MWRRLVDKILFPRIDDAQLHEILGRARQRLPPPVIWLFGKTQSGKTSLVRALTGASDAEIGNGFRPCTRSSRIYDFPNTELCLVRFLDTRGLGEVGYDPTDDLQRLAGESQLTIVVLKAMDHAQASLLEALGSVLRRQGEAPPLIVAQTTLHEGYPPGMTRHLSPYPFAQTPWPASLPAELAQSLKHQRVWFERHAPRARFVPLDFTLPEDGFTPLDYGLDALWQAIEAALPHGLRELLLADAEAMREFQDVYFAAAHPQIIAHATAAGLAAAVPLPVVDMAGSLAIVGKMFHALASIYQQPLSPQLATRFVGLLGTGFALRAAGRTVLKSVPFAGALVAVTAGTYMAACTYALGLTLCYYFSRRERGAAPDAETLNKVYGEAYQQGIHKFRDYLRGAGETA